MVEENNSSEVEKAPLHSQVTFLLAGFGALTAWNSLLNTFSYYKEQFRMDVDFYFPLPLFLATNLFSILLVFLQNRISIKTRVVVTLWVSIVLMIVFPLLAQWVTGESGFYLGLPVMFTLGAMSCVFQCSYISLANFFPVVCISLYFTGTGLAGVLVSLIRIITLAAFNLNDPHQLYISTVIYNSISTLILLLVYFNHLLFINSPYAISKLSAINQYNKQENTENQNFTIQKLENDISMQKVNDSQQPLIQSSNSKNSSLNNSFNKDNIMKSKDEKMDMQMIWRVGMKLKWLIVMVLMIYIQTFTVFPGLALEQPIYGLDDNWTASILVLTFNLADMISKYITAFTIFHNYKLNLSLIIFRFLFILSFILMTVYENAPVLSNSTFKVLHLFVFAFLNGFCTTISMILSSASADGSEKETAGFIMPFPLFFGIMLGSFIAIGMSHI